MSIFMTLDDSGDEYCTPILFRFDKSINSNKYQCSYCKNRTLLQTHANNDKDYMAGANIVKGNKHCPDCGAIICWEKEITDNTGLVVGTYTIVNLKRYCEEIVESKKGVTK